MRRITTTAVLAAAALTGCYGNMDPATNVAGTRATLNAHAGCAAPMSGNYFWETRLEEGQSTWVQQGMGVSFTCPADQRPDLDGYQWDANDQDPNTPGYQDRPAVAISRNAVGLQPNKGYEARIRMTKNDGGGGALNPVEFHTNCDGEGC